MKRGVDVDVYLTENYPSSKVIKAKQGEKGYKIKQADGKKLKFDTGGNFLKAD